MPTEIITKEDLEKFRSDLLEELKSLLQLKPFVTTPDGKQWLKSYEVRQMLGISDGTLKSMRIAKRIKHTKLGGQHFYRYDDILELMAPTSGAKDKPRYR